MQAATQQLGLGLLLSTLLISVPPMAGQFFNGVMGSSRHITNWAVCRHLEAQRGSLEQGLQGRRVVVEWRGLMGRVVQTQLLHQAKQKVCLRLGILQAKLQQITQQMQLNQ